MATRNKTETAPQRWAILADYFDPDGENIWLDDFIDDPGLRFEKVAADARGEDWHKRKGMTTGLGKWRRHFAHARKALATEPDGIITCFPQLAMAVGLLQRLGRTRIPVVAHNFNVGVLAPGMKRRMARAAAGRIDHFLVHSPLEVAPYAAYLGVPEARVRFAPLWRPAPLFARTEDTDSPFILAMGSAQRDYPTLIEALEPLGHRTIIITREDVIARLPKHDWIEYRHGMTIEACLELLSRARLSVTPVSNMQTASGQVTFLYAMRMGVPVIVTACPGTEGYIEDGQTGLLAKPFDAGDMRAKISALWDDGDARDALAARALAAGESRFSDEAAAGLLRDILAGYL